MSKAKKTPAVSWITDSRRKAIATLTSMAAEASDWHWAFGDQMLALIPIGKEESAVRFQDADGNGKRFTTIKGAYAALCKVTNVKVAYDQMLTYRTTCAAWPKADRPDPAEMCFYACQRLNGRRADTGPAGIAAMNEWIAHTLKEKGRVTVKDAEKRASDTNPSPLGDQPKPKAKAKAKAKAETLKPFAGPKAWDDYCAALEALLKCQPRSAIPNDGISDRLTAIGSAVVVPVPTAVLVTD